jgi:hypothetical protein
MSQFPFKIPISQLDRESRLYTDYVSGADSPVHDILGGYGRSRPVWDRAIGSESAPATSPVESWSRLVDRLVACNSALGAGADVIDKLEKLKSGGARVVITGQQPGVMGGALLTLHKINTAIALSEHVERTYGFPCLPLFWMGADDADFQEIRDLYMVDCDLSPLHTSIDAGSWVAASPVGDLPVDSVERVWKAVAPIVGRCPYGELFSELIRGALEDAADHGEVTAKILSALVSGRIAVVDGREPLVREHARDLFLDFFDNEPRVREQIAAAGARLEAGGYHAQLTQGGDSGVFQLEDGRRKKIVSDRREDARQAMVADIARFSPGVALRNLVQDHVFRPVAVVLGPAEIAYRAQLDDVYRSMQIHRPVAFPRMPGTWLSPPVARLVQSVDPPDMVRLLSDTGGFVKKVYESERLKGGEDAATRFRRVFRAESAQFLSAVAESMDGRTARKARKRLEDVSRRLDRTLEVVDEAGKHAALSNWPFLEGLEDFVLRKSRPQDRYLSCLNPYLFGGEEAASAVGAAAEAFVDGALDGRTPHVVYCV